MKSFENLYSEISENQYMKNAWKEARNQEKKINKICSIISIIVIFLLLLVNILKNGFLELNFINIFIGLIVLFITNLIIYIISDSFRKKEKEYNIIFKEFAIKNLIKNFYDNLEYFPQKGIPQRIYDEANYNERYDKYYSDDYIEAKLKNKYDIDIAEVKTQQETTYKDRNGDKKTTITTKFHGIFAKIVINKSIQSELRISPNGAYSSSNNRLEMDSSEFEKYFDVSATNKIIGMQLLTADIMEELIEFINKTNMLYDIVISNNIIYLRFHCGAIFESTSLKKGIVDKKILERYFYILNFTYNLSNKIINFILDTEI